MHADSQEIATVFDTPYQQTVARAEFHFVAAEESPALAFARGCSHQSGPRKLLAHDTVWREGEVRSHIFIVRSGALCFSRMLPDGRRIVLGFAYPGDIVGICCETHGCDAQTLQPSRLEAVPVASFKRAMSENPMIEKQAADAVAQALHAAYQHVVVISKLSAHERLASFLMDLSDRNERHGLSPLSVLLPMRRIDIADFLGLTIETVSRTFTVFRNAGLIVLDQANIVNFKDIRKLRALASGDGPAINGP
jgi:CRP/FNR family transcriptional regulator, anaerobic regulatory protein